MSITDTDSSGQEKDLSKFHGAEGEYKRWMKEIELVLYSKQQTRFENAGRRIISKFKAESDLEHYSQTGAATTLINILWSNVKILLPIYFCRLPKPVVERYFTDSDPVGRLACQIAERSTYYMLKSQEHRIYYAIRAAVQDRLLPGRGTVSIRLDYDYDCKKTENGEVIPGTEFVKPNSEKIIIDPLPWTDYLEAHARSPFEVRWKAKRAYMTRDDLVRRFGEKIGKAVVLGQYKDSKRNKKNDDAQFLQQAEVWEIEDKKGDQRLWVSEGYDKGPLDKKPSLGLKDFFSFPNPLLATTASDSQYPTADYIICEGLANQVDKDAKRLAAITDCIKIVGISAGVLSEKLNQMFALKDGQTVPVKEWQQFTKDYDGLDGVINWFNFDSAVAAVPVLQSRVDDGLGKIDLIYGIPDILRGSTDPNETLGAQQKKSKWVSVKVTDDQQDVQRFCSEIVGKMPELIFEPGLFADDTIMLMSGYAQMTPEDQQMFPESLALLRDDRLRTFRVGIETDSTIALDEEEQQARWAQWMESFTAMMQQTQVVQQFRPELMQPMLEASLASVRSLRTGRSIEGSLEKAMQQIEDNDAAAAQQPPPPDYEMLKIQNEQQKIAIQGEELNLKAQELGMGGQMSQADQERLNLDWTTAQNDYALGAEKNQIEMMKISSDTQIDKIVQDLEVFKEQFKQAVDARILKLEEIKTIADLKQQDHDQVVEKVTLAHEQKLNAIEKAQDQMSLQNDADSIENDRVKIRKETSEAASVK